MKTFRLTDAMGGRTYRVKADAVQEFYDDRFRMPLARLAYSDEEKPVVVRAKFQERWAGICAVREKMTLVGTLLLRLFGPGGDLVAVRMVPNLIVNTGRALIIDRLQAASPAVPDYLAIGTGGTAPAAANTTLETEIGTRVQGALSQPDAYTDRCIGTFAAGNGTGALLEAGRLNASSGGTLVTRLTYSVVNKAAGDSLQLTYDLTYAAS
jgi:hypothetical protein